MQYKNIKHFSIEIIFPILFDDQKKYLNKISLSDNQNIGRIFDIDSNEDDITGVKTHEMVARMFRNKHSDNSPPNTLL